MRPEERPDGRIIPYLVVILVAIALMARGMLAPPMAHDSFWIDFVWAEQFTALLRDGVLYPRWLPLSFDGLGSPVFYFYGPVAFYLCGIFGLIGFSTYGSIIAAFVTGMIASGLAMYRWLCERSGHALAGACLYMAAPYHLLDFYRRGALAEFTAFALLPLLALGLSRATGQGRIGLLAIAYALLIMTHLPTALLASVLLVAPIAIAECWRHRERLIPVAAGLAIGLCLAAWFLLPALLLQQHVSIERLWLEYKFRAEAWSFLQPSRWPDRDDAILMVILTAAVALPAALFFIMRRTLWPMLALLCCAAVAGFIPYFWSIPLLAKVQFPFRVLALAEFALATALAVSRIRPSILLGASIPMLTLSALIVLTPPPSSEVRLDRIARLHPDVAEYLPAGSPIEIGITSQWAMQLAKTQPPIVKEGDRTILRRFHFPAWQARCDGRVAPIFPDPRTRLISYRGRDCTIERRMTPPELAGLCLSLLSLLLLALASLPKPRALLRARSAAIGEPSHRPVRRPSPR